MDQAQRQRHSHEHGRYPAGRQDVNVVAPSLHVLVFRAFAGVRINNELFPFARVVDAHGRRMSRRPRFRVGFLTKE